MAVIGRETVKARAPALLGPGFLVMSIVFTAFTIAGWIDGAALAERGVLTTGVVVEKHDLPAESGRDYQLWYEFAAPDGVRAEGYGYVSQARYDATAVGDRVTVTYLPDRPGTNTLGAADPPPVLVLAVVLAFLGIFFVMGVRMTAKTLKGWSERSS